MQFNDFSPDVQRRLVDAYAAGLSAGSGGPWMLDESEDTIALVDAITDAYFRSLETWQAARPHWPIDRLIPAWLRAAQERDALPQHAPDDWIRSVATEGRP